MWCHPPTGGTGQNYRATVGITALHLLLAEAPIFTARNSPEALLPGRSDHFQPVGER